MKELEVDTEDTAYSDDQLDELIDLMVKSKEIAENPSLMVLIEKRSKARAGEITSIGDLKNVYDKIVEENTRPGYVIDPDKVAKRKEKAKKEYEN